MTSSRRLLILAITPSVLITIRPAMSGPFSRVMTRGPESRWVPRALAGHHGVPAAAGLRGAGVAIQFPMPLSESVPVRTSRRALR